MGEWSPATFRQIASVDFTPISEMGIFQQLSYTPRVAVWDVESVKSNPANSWGNHAMYGVPADLDLSRFKDAVLINLWLGEFQVDFRFQPNVSVSVEGKWELRDSTGSLVDWMKPNAQRDALYIHVLLGKRVEGFSLDAPRSFSPRFETGHVLTVFDESRECESFSIQPADIFV